jgi:DNA-binding Xre family transcriptional regulator
MIRVNVEAIKEAAADVGVTNPRQLSQLTGIDYRQCYLLYNGSAEETERYNPTVKTLDRLCEHLRLLPGDLLIYSHTPSREASQTRDDLPLSA